VLLVAARLRALFSFPSQSNYKGKTDYFCAREHKQIFDASPEKFAAK
jgi:hypothetical protein